MCIKVVGVGLNQSLADGLYSGSAVFVGVLREVADIDEDSRFIPLMEARRYRGGGLANDSLAFGLSASAFEP